MTKDRVKEEIGLLKFWLGVAVATCLALVAWLVANYNKALLLFVLAACVFAVLTFVMSIKLHRDINKLLDDLERIE